MFKKGVTAWDYFLGRFASYSREPREVVHCHLNYVVPDTAKWEQAASYYIDTHPMADAFEKNADSVLQSRTCTTGENG